MKKNMGLVDRLVRIIVAVVLAVLYFSGTVIGTLGVVLLILATFFLLTSVFGFCPLYIPMGLKTTRKR